MDKLHEGAYTLAFHAIICTKTYADRLFTQSSGAGGVDEEFVLELFKKIVMVSYYKTVSGAADL